MGSMVRSGGGAGATGHGIGGATTTLGLEQLPNIAALNNVPQISMELALPLHLLETGLALPGVGFKSFTPHLRGAHLLRGPHQQPDDEGAEQDEAPDE
jgi:hypothetical protein